MELKRAVKGGLGEQDCPFGFEDGTDEALQLGVRVGVRGWLHACMGTKYLPHGAHRMFLPCFLWPLACTQAWTAC